MRKFFLNVRFFGTGINTPRRNMLPNAFYHQKVSMIRIGALKCHGSLEFEDSRPKRTQKLPKHPKMASKLLQTTI